MPCLHLMRKIILIITMLLMTSAVVWAAVQAGPASFSNQYEGPLGVWPLRGAALKKFLTIKVFSAGLYVAQDVSSDQVLSDIPKRLEVVYLQNIPGKELQRVTAQGIRQNVDRETFLAFKEPLGRVNSWYPDVSPQDRIALTYDPSRGLELSFNGKPLGLVKDARFAQAFFSVWLGDNPVDQKMRRQLLGDKRKSNE